MRKYFITGSSRGLGKALTEILLREERNLVTGISRTNSLEHSRFSHFRMDLSQPEELIGKVDRLFDPAGDYEKVVLINNAGYLGGVKYVGDLDDDDFIRIYHINLTAPAILSNAFIRRYSASQCMKILLNISSGAAKNAYDGWSGYCSSKAGLDMLSKVMAIENEKRDKNFRIVSLAPGIIDTDMQQQVRETSSHDFSRVDRFLAFKENNQLLSPQKAAHRIIQFIEDLNRHPEVIQDIRDLGD